MEIANYTAEDFILDPSFRKWVLQPNTASNILWEDLLRKNPSKYEEAKQARALILRLNEAKHWSLSQVEIQDLWKTIDRRLDEGENGATPSGEPKVIPLNSLSTLERGLPKEPSKGHLLSSYGSRVACILAIAFGLGYFFSWVFENTSIPETRTAILEYVEHRTNPGVKSQLTLSDGSQVILNSGSTLTYVKSFEQDKREVYLTGEGYFMVAEDSLRPFTVHSRETKTTALGTSFNVKAYEGESVDISLLTGKIAVKREGEREETLILLPGEAVEIDSENKELFRRGFDSDQVIGWTKKWIIFKKTPLMEAIRVLENWYGVKVLIKNKPKQQVLLSGRFQDETLENVLEGLKFSVRFEYAINEENVTIVF
ncbi:FecR family protein [Lunatimonas salinarum]|uniref:FecR family protein n=1 Tax=Lunatimonas salinarum TaxID=1774590 RepID=UPI001ADED4A1|nr:FecR family protein [Lunatimonas salinarum]